MDIKRIQTAESFVLEGKLPCQQWTERGGQQGSPFLDGKAYSTEKISAYSFQAGLPCDFHVIRQWWAKHPSIVSAMHASCDPPDPQVHIGLTWLKGGSGLLLPLSESTSRCDSKPPPFLTSPPKPEQLHQWEQGLGNPQCHVIEFYSPLPAQ